MIYYVDRASACVEREEVYGGWFIRLLYGKSLLARLLSPILLPLFSKSPFFSRLWGKLQRMRYSRRKILPFIRKYGVEVSEFLEPVQSFQSFNAFFIRKLNPQCRPIDRRDDVAIMPADARYLFYPSMRGERTFVVKGQRFCLTHFLQDEALVERYAEGAMVIARLCPLDYHRFHFPFDCIPGPARLIDGALYSVNPLALDKHLKILWENKRMLTSLMSEQFGEVLFVEIGATYVGTIHQSFTPHQLALKGEEKGYFSFGGSSLVLLFEKACIQFDADLISATEDGLEMRARFGESLGKSGSAP